ncbi:ROK family transcriptional regulator [Cellulomonas aerilata]|uniref:NagC family transcriptional regulator n=1 Tax=Cellulomonas aerilata TaxID=515326 RepID=A0A512DH45_9CELL|nr:ROK family transcriptional regulator [Cellulomonas aerilata]GEO35791.1 NagC family transcriptional regulator [Cellulomonas aerilata]
MATKRALRPTSKVLPEDGRAHNRAMLLQHLFHTGPASRAELARVTGLTRVTVSDLAASLIADGLVAELGPRAEGRVGKPGTRLRLRTDAFQIVAIDLTADTRLHGAVLDLSGDRKARKDVAVEGLDGDEALAAVLEFARELVALADRPLLGVGIGSPGVVDAHGTVIQAPNRGWYGVGLAETLSRALSLPVHVANDANAAVLGEFTFGAASASGVLVVTVGQGVGAGIVVDGALVRGHGDAAGELGHVTVVDERDDVDHAPLGRAQQCACGRRGCLETVLSVPALRHRIAGLDAAERDVALAAVGRRLGVALAPVVSALNLSEVILSGPPELLGGPLRDAALRTIRERTIPVIGTGLDLRMTRLEEDGTLLGAAVLVLSAELGFG